MIQRNPGRRRPRRPVDDCSTVDGSYDIRAFAGDDITRAVVADEARALLARFDREVQHFDVTLEDRRKY
jgi:hypothetical protein